MGFVSDLLELTSVGIGKPDGVDKETPVVVGTSGTGIGPLPNLSTVNIDLAKANNSPTGLQPAEELQLIDASGNPLASPSAPDSDTDGFNDCAYAASCAAPSSS